MCKLVSNVFISTAITACRAVSGTVCVVVYASAAFNSFMEILENWIDDRTIVRVNAK